MHLPLSLLPIAIVAVTAIPVHNNATHTPQSKREDIQPIPSNIYRTRAQSAVNLGFWLVGERCKRLIYVEYMVTLTGAPVYRWKSGAFRRLPCRPETQR